jgi:hypothetical protein
MRAHSLPALVVAMLIFECGGGDSGRATSEGRGTYILVGLDDAGDPVDGQLLGFPAVSSVCEGSAETDEPSRRIAQRQYRKAGEGRWTRETRR